MSNPLANWVTDPTTGQKKPNWVTGYIPPADEWIGAFACKQDAPGSNIILAPGVGDGVADDSTAVNAALASRPGAVVVLPSNKKFRFTGAPPIIPQGATLLGQFDSFPVINFGTQSAYTLGSQVLLDPGLSVQNAGSIRNCMVIKSGMTLPVASSAAGIALAATFAGTGIVCTNNKAVVDNCLVLGFNQAIYSTANGKVLCRKVLFDCQNGIWIDGGYDISRMEDCEGGPLLSQFVPGIPAEDAAFIRTGDAFKFSGACDWSLGVGCFAYKYARNFVRNNCSNVRWVNCDSDSATAAGFSNTNTTYAQDIGCTAIAGLEGVVHTSAASTDSGGGLVVIGGTYGSQTNNLRAASVGGIVSVGSSFVSGTSCLNIGATTDSYGLVSPINVHATNAVVLADGAIASPLVIGNQKPISTGSLGDMLPNATTFLNTVALPCEDVTVANGGNAAIIGKYNRAKVTTPSGSTIDVTLGSDGFILSGSEQVIFFPNSCTATFHASGGSVVRSGVAIAAGAHVHAIYDAGSWGVYT